MRALCRWFDRLRHRERLRRGNLAHAWGKRGEDLAHRYLQDKHYILIARNWTTLNRSAEADLIARDGSGTLVFVEVKTRATDSFGAPEEAVDEEKRRRVIRAAQAYLRYTDESWSNVRFDIVTVLFEQDLRIEHIEGAFSVPGTGARR